MNNQLLMSNVVAFRTIARREVRRFFRFWMLTLVPAVITTTLYFMIFGMFLGNHIKTVNELPYIEFIVPGLIMMAVIYNSYLNVSSSLNLAKTMRHIEEIIVSPVYPTTLLLGYIAGGVVRGFTIAVAIGIVSIIMMKIQIIHLALMLLIIVATAVLFAIAGFINGVFARKFEDINVILVFALTPMTFLGGVFYSLDQLPHSWRWLSYIDPITYIVNAYRYSFFGITEFSVVLTVSVILGLVIMSYVAALMLLRTRIVKSN